MRNCRPPPTTPSRNCCPPTGRSNFAPERQPRHKWRNPSDYDIYTYARVVRLPLTAYGCLRCDRPVPRCVIASQNCVNAVSKWGRPLRSRSDLPESYGSAPRNCETAPQSRSVAVWKWEGGLQRCSLPLLGWPPHFGSGGHATVFSIGGNIF